MSISAISASTNTGSTIDVSTQIQMLQKQLVKIASEIKTENASSDSAQIKLQKMQLYETEEQVIQVQIQQIEQQQTQQVNDTKTASTSKLTESAANTGVTNTASPHLLDTYA